MKRVGLVRILKGTIVFLALMAAALYILAFPGGHPGDGGHGAGI